MLGNGLTGFSGDVFGYKVAFSLATCNYLAGAVVAATLPAPLYFAAMVATALRPRSGRAEAT